MYFLLSGLFVENCSMVIFSLFCPVTPFIILSGDKGIISWLHGTISLLLFDQFIYRLISVFCFFVCSFLFLFRCFLTSKNVSSLKFDFFLSWPECFFPLKLSFLGPNLWCVNHWFHSTNLNTICCYCCRCWMFSLAKCIHLFLTLWRRNHLEVTYGKTKQYM